MMFKAYIKQQLRELGYTVGRYDAVRDPVVVRKRLFDEIGFNIVFDVGANAGQYAGVLRSDGYYGRIVSFEPLSAAFCALQARAQGDTGWTVLRHGLGDKAGEATINISGNSYSSSLLAMTARLTEAVPAAAFVQREKIEMMRLDDMFDRYCSAGDRAYLKIDTQGYTAKVLDGAHKSLERIAGLEVEMSLVPLYEGEPLIGEIITGLYQKGFKLVLLKPEFTDEASGQQLQVDGIFIRS
jgi:FkbM family methyltransferase